MIARRKAMIALVACTVAVALPARGQQQARVKRIGYLGLGNARGGLVWLAQVVGRLLHDLAPHSD